MKDRKITISYIQIQDNKFKYQRSTGGCKEIEGYGVALQVRGTKNGI